MRVGWGAMLRSTFFLSVKSVKIKAPHRRIEIQIKQ